GQSLVVQGRVHRQGRAHLLLVLPGGSRSLIPTEWTDLRSSEDIPVANPSPRINLAPLSDLLHARTIADAPLRQLPAPDQAAAGKRAGKESQHPTEAGQSGGADPRPRPLAITERGTAQAHRRGSGH